VNMSLFIDAGSVELFLTSGRSTISELITAPLVAKLPILSVSNAELKVSGVSITPMA
jgi:levanase